MKRMWPPSRMCGRQSRVIRIAPSTFVCRTVASSSGVRLRERVAPEREPGVVEEDVDRRRAPARRASTNAAAALLVGDVERKRDVGVDPLDAPRTADDAHARLAQLAHRRSAEAARRARDDRGLTLEIHGRSLVTEPRVQATELQTSRARLAELDRLDEDRLERPVAAVALDERDRSATSWPDGHPAEDGVLAVEPRASPRR